jgi:ribosomal subunit interface protein
MEIIVRGRHITVPSRFRQHAAAKLARLEKLDQKAMRIDVEVSEERNPRQSDRRERVELTIRSRGPAIRAEAAADDRYTALDLALAKLEGRLRRASDRRKARHGDLGTVRSPALLGTLTEAASAAPAPQAPVTGAALDGAALHGAALDGAGLDGAGLDGAGLDGAALDGAALDGAPATAPARANGTGPIRPRTAEHDGESRLVPIQMEGDGPLIVREKVHAATPMTIDQALLEMELVGHDFYLFHDSECDRFSVVYRRRGYDYGVIRLVEE